MEITLTYTLPDFRPDIAEFAREQGLTVYYGAYTFEGDTEDETDYAMLVSVAHFDWEQRDDAEELQEKFVALTGEDEIDLYTGEEYWANFADRETLISCLEQFEQQISSIFPEVHFESVEFEE